MKDFSAFLGMRRYKNWAHQISSWKYLTIWRPVLPVFPRAQSAPFLLSTLNSFQGVLKISSCSSAWFNPRRGRWQVPMASANLLLTTSVSHFQVQTDSTLPLYLPNHRARELMPVRSPLANNGLELMWKLWDILDKGSQKAHWDQEAPVVTANLVI